MCLLEWSEHDGFGGKDYSGCQEGAGEGCGEGGLGVRIFFWTILVVLTLSLSFLCILLDSCRPR